jgi:hypothetical protein
MRGRGTALAAAVAGTALAVPSAPPGYAELSPIAVILARYIVELRGGR